MWSVQPLIFMIDLSIFLAHPTQCKSTNRTHGDGGLGSSFFFSSAGFSSAGFSSFFSSAGFSSFFSSGLASAFGCSYTMKRKHQTNQISTTTELMPMTQWVK